MKCAWIQQHRDRWPITRLCGAVGVSRARFYQWHRAPVSARAQAAVPLTAQVRATFAALHGRCGSPRVHQELRAEGVGVGVHRVARIMRAEGLQAKRPRAFRVTTQSAHAFPVAPNTLNQQFQVPQLNQVWAADVTYLPTGEGWLYLAVVLDLCSRRVVGWALRDRLTQPLTLHALEMALAQRGPHVGLLHHSDRGRQYASATYRARLAAAQLRCSMSRVGNCWDNAMVESFFATLKIELGPRLWWRTRAEARSAVVAFIEGWYNRQRRHSALGYVSPVAYEVMRSAAA